jgi:hypothetical protein
MDIVASDQLLLLATAAAGITLLLSVLVIAVRTRKIGDQLSELDAMRRSFQTVQGNLTEMVRLSDRTFVGLRELSGVGLHFRQLKRQQLRLSQQLDLISNAMETHESVLQLRDDVRGQREEIKEIIETSRSLQEWRSRVTAVYSDAGHLFESEPVRELLERFASPPASFAVEPPPRRSEGKRGPSQKKVRPRRQR